MKQIEVRRENKIKRNAGEQILQAIIYLIIILLCLAILLPCLNVLVLSFNDGKDAARGGIWFWPRQLTLDNFREVFKDGSIMGAYGISIARTVIGTFLSLMVTTLAGYALKQKDLPGRTVLTMLITFTMLFDGGMIPKYIQYKNLHLLNSFWVYVVPSLVSVTYLLMVRTFFEGIPDSLEESAQLDGAGYMTIFIKIVSPLCKPVYATVALFVAVGQWNSWFDAMLYNRMSDQYTTLQYELMKLLSSVTNQGASAESMKNATAASAVTPTSVRAAATILTMLPIVCLYPFLQRYFITGLTIGGVKE